MNISDDTNTFSSSPRHENIIAAVLVAILIVLAVVGNLLVIASFFMFRELRTICNYFVVSLSVADILVAILAMPFWCLLQITNNKWMMSHELSLFWGCVDILCGTSSTMNLAAVSMDRQCAITMPFSYPKLITSSRAILTIFFVWTFAIIVSTVRLVQWPSPGYYGYFVSCTSFFLPLLVMSAMYSRIFITARHHVRRINRRLATEVKAAKTIAVVIGCFVLCWAPFFSLVVLFAYDRKFPVSPIAVQVVKWLEYFNSCLNPLIYTCLNRNYRHAFKKLFVKLNKGICCSKANNLGRSFSWQRRSISTRNSMFFSLRTNRNHGETESNNKRFGVIIKWNR